MYTHVFDSNECWSISRALTSALLFYFVFQIRSTVYRIYRVWRSERFGKAEERSRETWSRKGGKIWESHKAKKEIESHFIRERSWWRPRSSLDSSTRSTRWVITKFIISKFNEIYSWRESFRHFQKHIIRQISFVIGHNYGGNTL